MATKFYPRDLTNSCRTCMENISEDNIMYDIFTIRTDLDIAAIISSYTSIQLQKDDRLPKKLCYHCFNCLIKFHEFRKTAEKVDVELKDYINKLTEVESYVENGFTIKVKLEHDDDLEGDPFNDPKTVDYQPNDETNDSDAEEGPLEIVEYKPNIEELNISNEEKDSPSLVTIELDKNDPSDKSEPQKPEEKEKELFTCAICSQNFKLHHQYDKHVLEHAPSTQKPDITEKPNDTENKSLKCDKCPKQFKSVKSLAGHQSKHTSKDRVLACSICNKVFKRVSALKRHELIHERNRPHKCSKSFATESNLTEHINKHNGVKTTNDSDAEKGPLEIVEYQPNIEVLNISNEEKGSPSLVTIELGKNDPSDKSEPQKPEEKEKELFTCAICSQNFKLHHQYVKHVLEHAPSTQKPDITEKPNDTENKSLKCENCPRQFKCVKSLAAHQRKHISKDRVLACSICNKVFKKVSGLKKHAVSHESNRPHKCTKCPKSFVTESNLAEHMNKHNGVKAHVCPICSKAFSHLSTLTNHVKVHTDPNPYTCPTCDRTFDSSTNLNQHKRRHYGLKTFACNLCPRQFVTKGDLKSHKITHTGERLYKCDQCTSSFTKRCALVKHTRVHSGIRPFQCDTCSMKFTSKDNLKRHTRVHTGERPYQCNLCDRDFTQSNDLIKHKRSHLGNNIYPCTECPRSFKFCTELRQHLSEHSSQTHFSKTLPVNNTGNTLSSEVHATGNTLIPLDCIDDIL